jgi:hypothetical protein
MADAGQDYFERLKKLLTPVTKLPADPTLAELLAREQARTGLAYVVVEKEDQ